MGATKYTVEQEVQNRYETAFETLANRCLGEPYSFHQIAPMLLPGLFNDQRTSAQIVQACLSQYIKKSGYTPQSIALECGLQNADLLAMAQKDSEMTLPDAMESFLLYHGQWAEIRIAKFVEGWVMKGLTSEEIQTEIAIARKDFGMSARLTSNDGKEEFENKLLAAIEGIVYTYPVQPFLKSLREVVSFYEPGDYIVVAALSGQGKTYYALNQIYYNALKSVPSCYINLEMTPANVQKRIWQMHAKQHFSSDLRDSDDKMREYLQKWEEVKKMPIFSYNPGRELTAIISTIRQAWYEHGIQFAVIDYAQKVTVSGYRGNRNYELGEVSGAIRALSLELQIPIMVMAQFKQDVSKTRDKRGGMYDIKDCADFTQDATMMQCLYRPGYFEITDYVTANGSTEIYPEGYSDVHIAKGREVGTALAKCRFDKTLGFYDEPELTQFPVDLPKFNSAEVPSYRQEQDVPF